MLNLLGPRALPSTAGTAFVFWFVVGRVGFEAIRVLPLFNAR